VLSLRLGARKLAHARKKAADPGAGRISASAAQPTPGSKRLDLVYMRAERAVETV